jgi:hypothetical protein
LQLLQEHTDVEQVQPLVPYASSVGNTMSAAMSVRT